MNNHLVLTPAEKVIDDILNDGLSHDWTLLREALAKHYKQVEYKKSAWSDFISKYRKKVRARENNVEVLTISVGRRIQYRKSIKYGSNR